MQSLKLSTNVRNKLSNNKIKSQTPRHGLIIQQSNWEKYTPANCLCQNTAFLSSNPQFEIEKGRTRQSAKTPAQTGSLLTDCLA
ncbi:MAG: hypothetical protein KDE56_18905, partial [Anaerolineales bacterium]|nr:hypothetical protein [Anaerolineales bacterium]